jgi:hypothetical protein
MATLTQLSLSIAQTQEQARLELIELTYGYCLACSDVEIERNLCFEISVDVLGDDVVRDDVLVEGLDKHLVEAGAQPIELTRRILLGQALLDEDVGDDEIKLRIRARCETGDETVAVTDVVHGRF